MKEYSVINKRAPRLDAPAKSTGEAKFIDDLKMSDMLFGALLQSPLPHAKILNIDTSEAEKISGVKAVITAKDVPHVKYGVSPARYDEELFCSGKVRYVGDEIAAAAATDPETAQQAVSLIKVDYEELPAVFDAEEAMKEGAPILHEKFPRNINAEVHQEFGDVDAAFKECDLIRTDIFKTKRQDAAFIEPHGCLAVFDKRGYLTLFSSTQSPHYVQRMIAMVLDLPIGKVRVIKPYVGGGFGPKTEANPLEMSASFLSLKTGKPVKMKYTREQVFLHCRARHQFIHKLTTGVKKDGTLLALKNEAILDGGAYSSFGIATIYYAGSLLGAPYKLPNMKYDGYRAYTNKPVTGAQRGHGGVAARAAWEHQLDLVADELGIDPIEMRFRNVMSVRDTTCNGLYMSSFGIKECLEAVKTKSGWENKRGKLPKGKGIGVACGFFVSGAGYPIYRSDTPHSTVTIKVAEDGGTVHLYSSSAEIGQGSDTTLAMIAAEAIGVNLSDIRVSSGDTDFGVDLGAYSSRQTLMTGNAAKEAGEDVKSQVLGALAEKSGVPTENMDIRNGLIILKKGAADFSSLKNKYMDEHQGWKDQPSGEALTFKEAARIAFFEKGQVIGTGKYKPPELGGSYKGAAVGTSPAYGCSAQVVEVSVDMETGKITVDKMTDAHDCGFAINRTSVEGQMQGSLEMGLGEALFEEVKFGDKGRILNANLSEYKIPTALDMPNVDCIIVESNEPAGPFGAKEVGEGAIIPTIPAILNAVYDAIGVSIQELPLTPERVFMALRDGRKKQ